MKIKLLEVSALTLALTVASCAMADECLRYEPDEITLVGTLTNRTYPGPPNYEDISRGDAPESVLILELSDPICVEADLSNELNTDAHANVRAVQIISRRRSSDSLLGRQVKATGTLFQAISGHHRTPVVLQAGSIHAAEQAN